MKCQYRKRCGRNYLVFFITIVLIISGAGAGRAKKVKLVENFYRSSCPPAEYIVRSVVNHFLSLNPGLGAGLLRLHFHDCFVKGCDASVLLDSITGQPLVEKDHPANNGSLRGFQVIDAAKTKLETTCPGIVSCADILAFAARDSIYKLGNIWYEQPSGRRDSTISLLTDVSGNLPPPFFNATQNAAIFANKGFNAVEMVTLSGAHSIGIAHCSSFASRLYPTVDPTMDRSYAAVLKRICKGDMAKTTVNQDGITPDRLDNKYYVDLIGNKGLFVSDQSMLINESMKKEVVKNARYGSDWSRKFVTGMVKMGKLGVLTGNNGEIRLNCRVKNTN
ncbi:peroxidase 5-like [Impatiens glandulifera]|uniref:peroxidase 5-like n=1 Tax=Impatiens glandulifera TaxID=253017 RepID=UPI001FB0FD43|nr:peroxidase 5-like [Impatiens glandulifera]